MPVLGYRTDTCRCSTPRPAARRRRRGWRPLRRRRASPQPTGSCSGGGLLVGRPPDESLDDIEPLIERALDDASTEGVHGQAVTPFVLSYLHRESGGRTLRANRDLIVGNARLAGEVAAAARAS